MENAPVRGPSEFERLINELVRKFDNCANLMDKDGSASYRSAANAYWHAMELVRDFEREYKAYMRGLNDKDS